MTREAAVRAACLLATLRGRPAIVFLEVDGSFHTSTLESVVRGRTGPKIIMRIHPDGRVEKLED